MPRLAIRDIGKVLAVPAALGAVSGVTAAILSEWRELIGFAAVVLTSLGLAWHFMILGARRATEPRASLPTMALAWLVVPAIGTLPFLASWSGDGLGADLLVDALFESVSGFTSCGLTVAEDASELARSIQLWRSLMQWTGGLGIAMLMITLINPVIDADLVLSTEIGMVPSERPMEMARFIWRLYLAATIATVVVFAALGMPAWEAWNHALTAVSTGGFTVTSDGLRGYSVAIQVAAAVAMFLGALSFRYYRRLGSDFRRSIGSGRLAASVAMVAVVSLAVAHLADGRRGAGDVDLGTSMFQATSAVATGGFSVADMSDWGAPALSVLVIAMVIGGASGSTAGGIKVDRALLLTRAAWWRIRRQSGSLEDQAVVVVDRRRYRMEHARLQAEAAGSLAAVWLGTLALGSFALGLFAPSDAGMSAVVFEAASALSSVGLSTGLTGPDLALGGKVTLVGLMWLGRLEILGGLVLGIHLWGVLRSRR